MKKIYVLDTNILMDPATGKEYKAGYYDENGVFYEDIVFSQHGKLR